MTATIGPDGIGKHMVARPRENNVGRVLRLQNASSVVLAGLDLVVVTSSARGWRDIHGRWRSIGGLVV
ncbi:hypothetical protein [Cellulomonas sp. P5_C6]